MRINKNLKRMLLIIIPLSPDVECRFQMEKIHSNHQIFEKNSIDDYSSSICCWTLIQKVNSWSISLNTWKALSWWLFLFHLMLNVNSKCIKLIQNHEILEKNFADNYSSFTRCWMFIRNGNVSFKIKKYSKRMLLIIIPLPSDVECWFEIESIHWK